MALSLSFLLALALLPAPSSAAPARVAELTVPEALSRAAEAFPLKQVVPIQSLVPFLALDPASRTLFQLDRSGRLEARRLGPDGSIEEKPFQELRLTKADGDVPRAYLENLAFDPVARTLSLWSGNTLHPLQADAEGRLTQTEWRPLPAPWQIARITAFDAVLRRVMTTSFLQSALFELLPDGTVGERPLQVLDDFHPLESVFHPGGRVLISGGSSGRLEVRRLDARGALETEASQSLVAHGGETVARLALDQRAGVLYTAAFNGAAFEARRVGPDGTLEREPFAAIPARAARIWGLKADEVSGSLIAALTGQLRRYRLDPSGPAIEAKLKEPPALKAASSAILTGQAEELRPLITAARASIDSDKPGWLRALWGQLAQDAVLGGKAPADLSKAPDSERWFPGAQAELKARMPALWRVLREPKKLGGLLVSLSFLRQAVPYYLANAAPEAPLAWARRTELAFALAGMQVLPVSESFRRHILAVKDERGVFAVELKIPGEEQDRLRIHGAHFETARELWEESPADPGVVQPMFFGRYQGRLRMYGQEREYSGEDPLGVMVFRYEDGKRLRNVGHQVKALAQEAGLDEAAYIRGARADAAAAAVRLHRLGWRGFHPPANDMHSENVRVLADGRGVLAGDFGAFDRAALSAAERAVETLMLVGLDPAMHRTLIEELVPLVTERLARGLSDPSALKRVEAEVLLELGLSAPSQGP